MSNLNVRRAVVLTAVVALTGAAIVSHMHQPAATVEGVAGEATASAWRARTSISALYATAEDTVGQTLSGKASGRARVHAPGSVALVPVSASESGGRYRTRSVQDAGL